MYYCKPKKSKKYKKIRRITVFLLVFVLIISFNAVIKNMIRDTVRTISKRIASQVVNDAVVEVLKKGEYNYDDFVDIINDENGAVQSISTKSNLVNAFKSELGKEVQKKLQENNNTEFKIPIGTLMDIGMLYDKGPEIDIRVKLYGEMVTSVDSTFISVGINQTRHSIMCSVSANIMVITPGFTEYTTVKGDYLVAETIIVGDVPDSYTNVNGDDSGIVGQIFDYANIE